MNTTKNTTKITKGAIHSSIVFNNNKDWNDNYRTLVFGTPVELVIPEAYMLWHNEGDVLELVCKRKTKKNGEKGMIFELHLNGEIIKEAVRFETIENFLYKKWSCEVYGINIAEDSNIYEEMTKALRATHAKNVKMGWTEESVVPKWIDEKMDEAGIKKNTDMEKAVDNAVDRIMENNIDSVGEDATRERFEKGKSTFVANLPKKGDRATLETIKTAQQRDEFLEWRQEEEAVAECSKADFVQIGANKYVYHSVHASQIMFADYFTCPIVAYKLERYGYITLAELIHFFITCVSQTDTSTPTEFELYEACEIQSNRMIEGALKRNIKVLKEMKKSCVEYYDKWKNFEMEMLDVKDFSLAGSNYNNVELHQLGADNGEQKEWKNSLRRTALELSNAMMGSGLMFALDTTTDRETPEWFEKSEKIINDLRNSNEPLEVEMGELIVDSFILWKMLLSDMKKINSQIEKRKTFAVPCPKEIKEQKMKNTINNFYGFKGSLEVLSSDWKKDAPRVLDAGWCGVVITSREIAEDINRDCGQSLRLDNAQGGWILWSDSTNDSFTKFESKVDEIVSKWSEKFAGHVRVVARQL